MRCEKIALCIAAFRVAALWCTKLQKEEDFEKQAKNKKKKTQFLELKIGPIMLRNILGPVFNFNLDQILTLKFCICFFFWGGGAETLIFIVLSAKYAKLNETQKTNKHYL